MIEGILPGICPPSNDLFWSVCLRRKVFAMMSMLRFLYIDGADAEVDIPHLPSNLRWFSWRSCRLKILPTNFYHKKLVHMDLSGSWIRQAWTDKPQNKNQWFQKLKVLNLRNCRDLFESPDFSWFPYLEKLDLQYCRNLGNLHKSIGDLKSLVELYLGATKIKELPDSICKLSSLKILILGYCYSLEKLPESIGDLKSLVELDLHATKMEELPDNICRLSSLEHLLLGMCASLRKLPESIGDLKSLVDLDLSATKIEELPDSICRLSSLKMLDLYLCPSLNKLPGSICNLNSLVSLVLQIVGMGLESLPELPSTLIHLVIQNCYSFQKTYLLRLKKLRILRFNGCKKLEEIQGLEGIDSLEEFCLHACDTIESLPKLPSTLTILKVGTSISLHTLPDFSSLKNLRVLSLSNCKKLEEIRGLEGTKSLEEFYMYDCGTIESFPELPSTLTYMEVMECNSLKKLPDLSNLKNLRTLRLRYCKKLEAIRGLEGTKSLEMLDVDDCNTLADTPRKILGQGTLLMDELQRSDSLNVNGGIYKGLILCLVFGFPFEAQEVQDNLQEHQPVIVHLYSKALIRGKHRNTECAIDLQVEGVEYTTERDIIYIHHFKGFDWFGFPLEGKDVIEEISIRAGGTVIPFRAIDCKVKFWKLLLESEQQIPNPECSARMVADFFSWTLHRGGISDHSFAPEEVDEAGSSGT